MPGLTLLITGSGGILGRALAIEAQARGWDSRGFPHGAHDAAEQRSWSQSDVFQALLDADVVVGLAAMTDVAGCQCSPAIAAHANTRTAEVTAEVCSHARKPFVYVSTDYVSGHPDAPHPYPAVLPPRGLPLVYSATKAAGEWAALAWGGHVARVSHLDPAKTDDYEWLNGYTVGNRESTTDCVRRLADFLYVLAVARVWGPQGTPRIVHLVPDRVGTVTDIVREWNPLHQGLSDIVTDPAELSRRMGFDPPADVRLAVGGE